MYSLPRLQRLINATNVVSHLLTDESYIKELAKTDRKGLQRIYDAIVDFFDKIFKRYSEDASPREAELKDALKELQGEFNTIKAMYENALKETTNVQQSKMVLPKSGNNEDELNSKEGEGKNGDDKSRKMPENDERYSEMQTRTESEAVQNRSFGESHTKPRRVDEQDRYRTAQKRTSKVEIMM